MYDKNNLDEMTTPTGYHRKGRHVTPDQSIPQGEPTNRTCPDCTRKQYKYGRFYICPANHAYNERGEKIGV